MELPVGLPKLPHPEIMINMAALTKIIIRADRGMGFRLP